MTRLHMRDLNGFKIADVPDVLPPSTVKPPSFKAAARECFKAVFNTPDEVVFRKQVGSLENAGSQSGNLHADRAFAARKMLEHADHEGMATVTEADRPIGKIMGYLPDFLKEHELDRQSRLRKALEDKRRAEASGGAAAQQSAAA